MNSKKQTILVSGITGFLGRNLLKIITLILLEYK